MERENPELRERIADVFGPELLFADGHDNAIIGVVARCGKDEFVLYDKDVVVENLEADGMTVFEAMEWLDFNWAGAWVGPHTPGLLTRLESM